jgi:Reverse transcriptase (RNA-dependent DNA polymerase)
MTRLHALYMRERMVYLINQDGNDFDTSPKIKRNLHVWSTKLNLSHLILHLDINVNGNTLWGDATALELAQINEYITFINKGHHTKASPPNGFKKIRAHLVFDVNHDGRHKARLVADGHLTDIPIDSVYSGVVSLQGFRLVLFLAELNNLQLWATEIGNAYVEAYTTEKVYVIASPEFGGREGHILVISKALYRLRSSGARWHDRFADCIRELGFFQW